MTWSYTRGMFRLLPRVWRMYRGGDDHLLSGVVFRKVMERIVTQAIPSAVK